MLAHQKFEEQTKTLREMSSFSSSQTLNEQSSLEDRRKRQVDKKKQVRWCKRSQFEILERLDRRSRRLDRPDSVCVIDREEIAQLIERFESKRLMVGRWPTKRVEQYETQL